MLSQSQVEHFNRQGYVVLPDFIAPERLARLAEVCDRLLTQEAPVDGGGKFHNLGRGDTLRFLRQRFEGEAGIRDVLFSPEVAGAAADLLQVETSYMFNEQFVVKAPSAQEEGNSAFAWHQDGSYVGFVHKPYLTMWLAIDEATAENGALRVLPRDLGEDSSLGDFSVNPQTNERVCHDGIDDGEIVPAKPGTMVIFSSTTMHSSAPNLTGKTRRAWLCQYTPEPIIDPSTGLAKHIAAPMHVAGKSDVSA